MAKWIKYVNTHDNFPHFRCSSCGEGADNSCNFNDIGVALKVIDTLVDSKSFEMKG